MDLEEDLTLLLLSIYRNPASIINWTGSLLDYQQGGELQQV